MEINNNKNRSKIKIKVQINNNNNNKTLIKHLNNKIVNKYNLIQLQ